QGDDWIEELKQNISATLEGKESVRALWQWESLVRQAGVGISLEITSIAHQAAQANGAALEDGLKVAMQLLVQAQAEGDLSAGTAPHHLTSALGQLLVDQLDHVDATEALAPHGEWLAANVAAPGGAAFGPKLNALLLTASVVADGTPLLPGTVYKVGNDVNFEALFGASASTLKSVCYQGKAGD